MSVSIFDKAKSLLSKNKSAAKTGIDKAGDIVDQKTGGKYESQVDTAQEKAKDVVDKAEE
jgi:MT0933-like antitoxin protein